MTKDKELLDLALEALRSAAAELYRASSYCNTYEVLGNTNDAITAIQQARSAQPAPVQPVACQVCGGSGFIKCDALQSREKNNGKWGRCLNCQPYTTPPAAKRPFVRLTDEEISDIAINNPPMVHEFARAIEAKLKEKNT